MATLCGSWGTVSHQIFQEARGRRCCTVCTPDGAPWKGPECLVSRSEERPALRCRSCLNSSTAAPAADFGILRPAPGISLSITRQKRNSVENWPSVLIDFTARERTPRPSASKPCKRIACTQRGVLAGVAWTGSHLVNGGNGGRSFSSDTKAQQIMGSVDPGL